MNDKDTVFKTNSKENKLRHNACRCFAHAAFFDCPRLCVWVISACKALFTWRCGTPDRWGKVWQVTPPICKRDQFSMRDYIDRRVTPPKLVTSPSWGPPTFVLTGLKTQTIVCVLLMQIEPRKRYSLWKTRKAMIYSNKPRMTSTTFK